MPRFSRGVWSGKWREFAPSKFTACYFTWSSLRVHILLAFLHWDFLLVWFFLGKLGVTGHYVSCGNSATDAFDLSIQQTQSKPNFWRTGRKRTLYQESVEISYSRVFLNNNNSNNNNEFNNLAIFLNRIRRHRKHSVVAESFFIWDWIDPEIMTIRLGLN